MPACLQPQQQHECNFLSTKSCSFYAVPCLCFVFMQVCACVWMQYLPICVRWWYFLSDTCIRLRKYRKYGTSLPRRVLSLHVHVFIRDPVLAYVSGLSRMACFFLFLAHEGCMHLEANIYAFCFNTLLVLSLYSVGGGTGLFVYFEGWTNYEPFSEQKQNTILVTSRILFCEVTHKWFRNSSKLFAEQQKSGRLCICINFS